LKLSIIIPTLQEEATIGKLIAYLKQCISADTEIIVADGGSTDATSVIAEKEGAKVILCSRKGRGQQMNVGATEAQGDILYFLHADTFPAKDFEASIKRVVEGGYESGCFRLRFDLNHWFLSLNAWFTRFDLDAIRFGDQSLFVKRTVFENIGGFDEHLHLLEDQEIIVRLKQKSSFCVLPNYVTTSARKYKQTGVYKLQAGYFVIYTLYRFGVSQQKLVQVYRSLIS
jgi:rSAM/selenodomain-associated transferase 2